MAAEADDSNDEMDDDGMDDPLVLRGLLQCLGIGLFHTIRYVMDVLFTPHVVQAVPHQVEAIMHRLWTAVSAWYAPLMWLLLLHLWGSLNCGIFAISARWALWCCIVRAMLTTLMDDTMVVGRLRKRQPSLGPSRSRSPARGRGHSPQKQPVLPIRNDKVCHRRFGNHAAGDHADVRLH